MSSTGSNLQLAGGVGSLTSAGMLAFGAKGGAIVAAAGPVGWAALGVTALGGFLSARKKKKRAKELADQRNREIAELRRRAQENANLIIDQGTRDRASVELAAARGNITGESILNKELQVVDIADKNAQKVMREAEFAIQGMQMEIANQKQLADDQYKADMINVVTSAATSAVMLSAKTPPGKKPDTTIDTSSTLSKEAAASYVVAPQYRQPNGSRSPASLISTPIVSQFEKDMDNIVSGNFSYGYGKPMAPAVDVYGRRGR